MPPLTVSAAKSVPFCATAACNVSHACTFRASLSLQMPPPCLAVTGDILRVLACVTE